MYSNKKKYFASDFHLGYPDRATSLVRERKLVAWLDSISDDADEIFLLGDVFDFWYEYTWVVPRGFVRFLGKLAELSDAGVIINVVAGNHDLWYKDYLVTEVGARLLQQPVVREWNGKRFFMHHGHALGNYDRGMNFLNAVFSSTVLQFLFERIHPEPAFWFAHKWSSHNRKKKIYESSHYLGDDKEWLLRYSKDLLKNEHFHYFIYGHRHLALDKPLGSGSRYINLGNWITLSTYGVWDGECFELKEF